MGPCNAKNTGIGVSRPRDMEPAGSSSTSVYGWRCRAPAPTVALPVGSDGGPRRDWIHVSAPRQPGRKAVPKRAPREQVAPDSSEPAAASNEPAGEPQPTRQLITDARTMRALAHPVRVALLEAIRRDGEITATRAAELLDESPGNMSWHLQTLAKYGFVEETGEGRGRSRPWRLASESHAFDTGMADPGVAAASEALERTLVERSYDQLREWWSRRLSYPTEWRSAAFMSNSVTYLTAAELAEITDEINAIYTRYWDRSAKEKRPADALPVHLSAHGHPLPPSPSGN
jgi:DNA-binding transcriptional ArsR family regulator